MCYNSLSLLTLIADRIRYRLTACNKSDDQSSESSYCMNPRRIDTRHVCNRLEEIDCQLQKLANSKPMCLREPDDEFFRVLDKWENRRKELNSQKRSLTRKLNRAFNA